MNNRKQSKEIDVDELEKQRRSSGSKYDNEEKAEKGKQIPMASIPAASTSAKAGPKTIGLDDEVDCDDFHKDQKKTRAGPKTTGLEEDVGCDDIHKKKTQAFEKNHRQEPFTLDTKTVDLDTLLWREEIQDLPSRLEAQPPSQENHTTPGAFAVGGHPSGFYPPTTARLEDASDQAVGHDEVSMALDATLVDEENQATTRRRESCTSASLEVVEGKAIPDKSQKDTTAVKKWISLVSTLLVLGAVMILAIFSAGHKDSKKEEEKNTSQSQVNVPPSEPSFPPFLQDLPLDILSKIQKQGTPEYRANRWMWQDPHLQDYSKQRQVQRFAMVVFYYSTKGDDWLHNDGWLDYYQPECTWFSSYTAAESVCDDDSHIQILDFHDNNLQGTLPGLTNSYPQLRYFNVANNYLTGLPPPLYSKLTNMEAFILSNNRMQGQFISDAGFAADNLRIIQLDRNHFSGYLNPVFAVLPKLEILNLTSNAFANEVPTEFQYNPNLEYLGMADNLWYGTLPSELGLLTNLQEMHFQGNANLVGTLPSELGDLEKLRELDIRGTQITGSIPLGMCERAPLFQIMANCSQVDCCSGS